MSDTPRVDAQIRAPDGSTRPYITAGFARQLERELNAAQATIRQQQLLDEEIMRLRERVKRLEEAGDKMQKHIDNGLCLHGVTVDWKYAKEANP